ncbi:MAG: hypothetical protein ACLTER_10815 [Ruminococcus sp.]
MKKNYPFNAVVTQEGKKVHYGNWQIPVNLGSIGVIYWEHEEGGANDGYHFSYIGYKASSQDPTSVLDKVGDSTLCTRHDDGGRITEYGYGYYYATGSAEPDPTMYCFQAGDSENAQASENLDESAGRSDCCGIHYRPSDWNKPQLRYELLYENDS